VLQGHFSFQLSVFVYVHLRQPLHYQRQAIFQWRGVSPLLAKPVRAAGRRPNSQARTPTLRAKQILAIGALRRAWETHPNSRSRCAAT
jgi:hypothetical protein